MAFQRIRRNRRKLDAAERKAALAGALRKRGLPVLKVALAIGLVLGIVAGGKALRAWALTSPRFALQRVTFGGLQRASEAELGRLTGLVPGQNLFLVDLDLAQRALQAHPWIRKVRVLRELPAAVRVEVEEHVPVAMASLGDLYLVNPEGEAFKKLESEDLVDLPLITGVERDTYVQDPSSVSVRFKEALALIDAYEASGASRKARLSEVRVGRGGWSVVTDNGQELRFTDGAPEEALRRLYRVRTELARRGLQARVIHLDNRTRPDRVTVKLVGQELREDSTARAVKVASSRE